MDNFLFQAPAYVLSNLSTISHNAVGICEGQYLEHTLALAIVIRIVEGRYLTSKQMLFKILAQRFMYNF